MIDTLINNFNGVIIKPIVGLLFTLAVVVFLWGIVEFIWKAGSVGSEKKESGRTIGKRHMVWGIIGLFIMVSVVAIINIFLSTLGINNI